MTRRPHEHWTAESDLHKAIVRIITLGGTADKIATDIHQAYLGRGWTPAKRPTGLDVTHCTTHKSIKNPCPLCQMEKIP